MPGPFLKPTTPHDRQKLGKYDLLGRLSTTGMHALYLAVQTGMAGFRKIVVLKSIIPDIRGEEDLVRMFLEEARITSSFDHPNIAQVFDLDTDDDMLFLAMEFVQGAALAEIARAPVGFVLPVVRDTALALHYAHTYSDPRGRPQPVVHRKVSSKNVMVTFQGTTKLLDFGIAKSLAGRGVSTTSIGQVKGAGGYMSPEQVLGEPLDARTDIFSLGVVLHEGLTGKRLFERASPDEEMRAVLEEIAPPSATNPQVGPALDRVTQKALARNRDHRFATALELARALETAADGAMWHPEQLGDLVKQLHADRLRQIYEVVQHAQGSTGEHSGLHITDVATATNPAIVVPLSGAPPPPPAEKITTEHIAFEPNGPDETTAPLRVAAPKPHPRNDIPTQSMRGPSQLNMKSVPAFKPELPPANVTLDEPTGRSDAGVPRPPDATVPFTADEPEPRTTIARPQGSRGKWWLLVAALAVAAAGVAAYTQGWIAPRPPPPPEPTATQTPPPAPEPIVAEVPVVAIDAGASVEDAGIPEVDAGVPAKKKPPPPAKKKKKKNR